MFLQKINSDSASESTPTQRLTPSAWGYNHSTVIPLNADVSHNEGRSVKDYGRALRKIKRKTQ